MAGIESIIQSFESWGLTDVILPFLLIFTIIFAVMQKTRVLGDDKRNINMVIAFVIALLVVIPHVTGRYPAGLDVVSILNSALPAVSLVVVAVLMLLILIGLFGQEAIFLGMTAPGWVTLFSVLAIVFIFANSAGWVGDSGVSDYFGEDTVTIIVVLLVFGIVIGFITGEEKDKEARSAMKRMGVDFSKLFGGGGHH